MPLKIPSNARVTPFSLTLFAARLRYGHQALVGTLVACAFGCRNLVVYIPSCKTPGPQPRALDLLMGSLTIGVARLAG